MEITINEIAELIELDTELEIEEVAQEDFERRKNGCVSIRFLSRK